MLAKIQLRFSVVFLMYPLHHLGEYSGVLAQNFRVVARGVGKNEVNVLCPFIFLDLQSTAGDHKANS